MLLLDWVNKNVYYPNLNEIIIPLGYNGEGIYKINNSWRLFLRNGPASWTIRKRLARCGEDARYFVEIMGKTGVHARVIKGEGVDHALAEYYTKEGYAIIVDPSSNRVGIDLSKWMTERNVTKLVATDLNGKKEDITKEYLS